MTMFDERERAEEAKFRHDQEFTFKVRNRRNKLFGLWVAGQHLGLTGEAAAEYAKDVVMADFASPGEADLLGKVKADLAKAGAQLPEAELQRRLDEMLQTATAQVRSE